MPFQLFLQKLSSEEFLFQPHLQVINKKYQPNFRFFKTFLRFLTDEQKKITSYNTSTVNSHSHFQPVSWFVWDLKRHQLGDESLL